jgi:hypothetical protein
MKCLECDGEMVSVTITVDYALRCEYLLGGAPAILYFQETRGRDAVLKYRETPRLGVRNKS